MLKSLKFVSYIIFLCSIYSISYSQTLGLGRTATSNEITAWDIDVRPDGKGLPVGSGSVIIGEELYTDNCASCHGAQGLGDGQAGRSLEPSPALLRQFVQMPMSGDEYLLWTISEGGERFGTDMPAFEDKLGEEDIWKIIAYMRAGFP